jgi:hypothetical protein
MIVSTTATALGQGVVNLRRHDELPGIGVEQIDDGLLDFALLDQVAMTDEH